MRTVRSAEADFTLGQTISKATAASKIEDITIPEDWPGLKIAKLGVCGSFIVANIVSIPRECPPPIFFYSCPEQL